MEKFRACEIVVGNQTFDGRDDELVVQPCLEFLEMIFQVGRRYDKYQSVVGFNYFVDLA